MCFVVGHVNYRWRQGILNDEWVNNPVYSEDYYNVRSKVSDSRDPVQFPVQHGKKNIGRLYCMVHQNTSFIWGENCSLLW